MRDMTNCREGYDKMSYEFFGHALYIFIYDFTSMIITRMIFGMKIFHGGHEIFSLPP